MPPKVSPEPWIKPDTRRFLHRLWLTVLILGTLLGLLAVSAWAINSVFAREARQREDQSFINQLSTQPEQPIEERIAEHETILDKLRDEVSREEERRKLARLYEEQGRKRITDGKRDEAEASFRRAIELAPTDPIYPADLALLFSLAAREEPTRNAQIDLWKESSFQWIRALELEEKPGFRNTYAQSATDAAITACELMNEPKRRAEALTYLKQIRVQLPPGSNVFPQIDRMESILTGGSD